LGESTLSFWGVLERGHLTWGKKAKKRETGYSLSVTLEGEDRGGRGKKKGGIPHLSPGCSFEETTYHWGGVGTGREGEALEKGKGLLLREKSGVGRTSLGGGGGGELI